MRNQKKGNKKQEIKTESSPLDRDFELWVILDEAEDVISKARELELNQFQLTKAQASILHRLLTEDKGLTIIELAKGSAKELSSVLNLVKRMGKNGLVKKSQNNDGKIVISITPKGHELYSDSTHHSIEMIFSVLSQEEKQQLILSLVKLRDKGRELLGIDFRPAFLKS